MKIKKQIGTLRFRLLIITIISITMLFILMIISGLSFIYEIRDEFFETNNYVVETFSDKFEVELNVLDSYVESLYAENNSFHILTHQLGMLNRINWEYYLKNAMQSKADSINEYGGVFYYDGTRNALRSCYSGNYSTPEMYSINHELRGWLYERRETFYSGIESFDNKKFLLTIRGNGTYCVGYFLELNRFYENEVLHEDSDIQLILVDKDSNYLCDIGEKIIEEDQVLEAMQRTRLNGYRYLLVSSHIGGRNIRLVMIRPYLIYMRFWQKWYFWISVIAITVINVIIAFGYNAFAKKVVLVPINKLVQKVNNLEKKDIPHQKETYSKVQEFREIEIQIDELIRRIYNLQYEIFKVESEKQQVELQSYQICLKPHFFLNCLKSIDALYQNNSPSLDVFLRVLSDYMRKRLSYLSATVSLAEEEEMIQDYYSLMSILHQTPVLLEKEIAENTKSSLIPVFALQTFVENSYKYAQINGKILDIKIRTSFISVDGKNILLLVVSDNGKGYSDKMIAAVNQPLCAPVISKEHIGIDNLRSRLWLLYGEKAKVILYNGVSGGAVAEVYIEQECADTKNSEEGRRG